MLSQDGKLLLSVSDDATARIWNIENGNAVLPVLRHPNRVIAGEFSPDGKSVATCCQDGAVRIWDVVSGRELVPALRHAASPDDRKAQSLIVEAHFSPDGKSIVTAGGEGSVELWNAQSRPCAAFRQAQTDGQ